MKESSKQRMELGAVEYAKTVAPESIEQWVTGGYRKGYQAGMQDPDAKKIFVGGVYWDAEKIEEMIRNHTNQSVEAAKSLRESLVLIQKLQEENKRLREAT